MNNFVIGISLIDRNIRENILKEIKKLKDFNKLRGVDTNKLIIPKVRMKDKFSLFNNAKNIELSYNKLFNETIIVNII